MNLVSWWHYPLAHTQKMSEQDVEFIEAVEEEVLQIGDTVTIPSGEVALVESIDEEAPGTEAHVVTVRILEGENKDQVIEIAEEDAELAA